MRLLVPRIFALCLSILSAAQTSKGGDGGENKPLGTKATTAPTTTRTRALNTKTHAKLEPSSLNAEHRQLRDLLASQAEELEATREQLRQLQQRMESMENQLRTRSEPRPALDIVGTSTIPPSLEDVAQPTAFYGAGPMQSSQPAIAEGGSVVGARLTDQSPKSNSIELANGKVRIGTVFYADHASTLRQDSVPNF
jgi:hypothetical protein